MGFLRRIFGRDLDASTASTGRVLTVDTSVDSGLKWASPLPTPASTDQVLRSTGDAEGDFAWGADFDLPAAASSGQVLTATGTDVGDYAWSTGVSIPLEVTVGLINSDVSSSYILPSRVAALHIVSAGGGGGGGNGAPSSNDTPGGFAGNTGVVLEVLYINTGILPITIDVTVGRAGEGGDGGHYITHPGTDGGDANPTTVVFTSGLDVATLVVPGGKGGWRGGLSAWGGSTSSPYPSAKTRGVLTINGNTVFSGEYYTVGSHNLITKRISWIDSAEPDRDTGDGGNGLCPTIADHIGYPKRTIQGGIDGVRGASAPASALGYSGAGGASQRSGAGNLSGGGSGGPGIVTLSI